MSYFLLRAEFWHPHAQFFAWDGKESACNSGDPDLILGLGRSPGSGNGNLHQYSCLQNSMDRGAWQAIYSMRSQRVQHDWATKTHKILTLSPNLQHFRMWLSLVSTVPHVGSWLFNKRLNLCPLQRKPGVLTTAQPEKSPNVTLFGVKLLKR